MNTGEGGIRRTYSYVVVPSRPSWVELHVQLSFLSGQLVVLGLFLPGQCMPLETHTTKGRSVFSQTCLYTVFGFLAIKSLIMALN